MGLRLVRRLALGTGLAVVTAAAASAAYQARGERADRRKFPPPGQLIQVKGRRLHLWCQGDGAEPTVVVIPALGAVGLEWSGIQRLLAPSVWVCLYDRGGLGWSEFVPGPRTVVRLSDELRELLAAGAVPAPYLLVGHSVGGVIARDFATRYRDLTAGLVLVDSSHELMMQRFAHLDGWRGNRLRTWLVAGRDRLQWLGVRRALDDFELMPRDRSRAKRAFPSDLVEAGLALSLTSHQRRADIRETLDMEPGFAEAYALRQRLDGLPLTVLTSKDPRRSPAEQQIWDELQADLASLADGGVHQVVAEARHHIHLDQPQAVVKAIVDMHDQVRQRP